MTEPKSVEGRASELSLARPHTSTPGAFSRFILVEIEPGLDRSRYVGIWCAVKQIPGVHSLTDLTAVSQSTLDAILFNPPAPTPEPEPVRQAVLL